MRHLVTARRRAEEFAAAVDDRSGTSSTARDVDATFLELVEQLRDLEAPTLRPEFSADLRSRLMDEAATVLAEPAAPARAAVVAFPASPRRRLASAAAATCIVVGSVGGVAAASQSALPGETLYPIKRGIEHIELAVAGSEHAKGGEYLEQARTRLDEISDLTVAHADDPATPGLVRDTLETFTAQAGDGADALMQSYDDTRDPSNIRDVRSFADDSAQRLDALSGTVPSAASTALADAARLLRQLDQRAQQACPDCSTLPPLALSGALLQLTDDLLTPGQTVPDAPAISPDSTRPTNTSGQQQQQQGPAGVNPSALPSLDSPPSAGSQEPGEEPSADSPGLPDITGLDPTPAGPTPTGSQPGGVTVQLPGGGGVTIGTQVPSVPIPTVSVDLNDPVGSIPDVVDDVTTGLGLPGIP